MIEDKQVIEILGRNRLVDELLSAGLEVALPLRDRGIDLIAYADSGDGLPEFAARPIQMKAASCESFSLDSKYSKFHDMILAFIWNIGSDGAGGPVTYALCKLATASSLIRYSWTMAGQMPRYDQHEEGFEMNRFRVVALMATLGSMIFQAQGQTPPSTADPYANNPDAGKTKFPDDLSWCHSDRPR
jgi:hypothetical protein